MEQFIRDKYEKKTFMDPANSKSKFKVGTRNGSHAVGRGGGGRGGGEGIHLHSRHITYSSSYSDYYYYSDYASLPMLEHPQPRTPTRTGRTTWRMQSTCATSRTSVRWASPTCP